MDGNDDTKDPCLRNAWVHWTMNIVTVYQRIAQSFASHEDDANRYPSMEGSKHTSKNV